MKKILFAVNILVTLTLFLGVNTALATPVEKVIVIIGFDRTPGSAEEALIRDIGGDIKYTYRIVPAIAASVPEVAIPGLLRNPRVKGVEPNIIFHAIEEYPWGILQIGADEVHSFGNIGSNIKVAVIDTGIDYNHPELSEAYAGGYDFVNDDLDPMDDNGHGTHVAGTIAAALNGIGVAGVAPGVELYALKVLDSTGSGNLYDIIEALDWACGNNPQNVVIQISNNSYGSLVDDPLGLLQLAFDISYDNDYGEEWDLLHVAAAGNSGTANVTADNVQYPAKYDSVIAVAATDQGNNRASFSSTGPAVELAAPGVNIKSTFPDNSYAWGTGTSMACPHVVGTAALIMSAYPGWTNIQVRQQLRDTANDLGINGKDNLYGYGLVDADEAVALPNNPPVAYDDCYSTNEDTTLSVTAPGVLANDSDAENNNLTTIKVSEPSHGDVTLNADGSFSYTPQTNFSGTDSFTYKAYDGSLESNTATVTITVTAISIENIQITNAVYDSRKKQLIVEASSSLGGTSNTLLKASFFIGGVESTVKSMKYNIKKHVWSVTFTSRDGLTIKPQKVKVISAISGSFTETMEIIDKN
jgi:subtilisin